MKLSYVTTGALALGLVVAGSATTARAASFTTNFCPGDATCPVGITQANITFEEILTGTDPNDYNVYVKIIGTGSAPALVGAIDFTITGVSGDVSAGGYQALPTLISAPGGIANWTVSFDKISNSGPCANAGAGNAVCAQSTNAVNARTTNMWQFFVNLGASAGMIGTSSSVDLRAHFLNANGSNAGILSPGAQTLVGCTRSGGCDPGDVVPEPTTMALLGLGLLGAGIARRRKQ